MRDDFGGYIYKKEDKGFDKSLLKCRKPLRPYTGHGSRRVAKSPEEAINLAIYYGMSLQEYVDYCKSKLKNRTA